MVLSDTEGEFLLDLERPLALKDGDGLVLDDGGIILVKAAEEAVADISAPTQADIARIAWHIGNRHTPLQVLDDGGLRFQDDGVLSKMVEGLGAHVTCAARALLARIRRLCRQKAAGMITTMVIRIMDMAMSTERSLYKLMTWLSPAFPVGAFSYSHGLEWAVEDGLVPDEARAGGLDRWPAWRTNSAPSAPANCAPPMKPSSAHDAEGIARRHRRGAGLAADPREFALESLAQGKAFLATLREASPPSPALTWAEPFIAGETIAYPSAVGIAAALHGVGLRETLVAYLQAFVGNLVSAGIRLIPLGQTAGQRILAGLEAPILAAAETALARDLADVGTAAPLADWASMKHETQYTRLFRS